MEQNKLIDRCIQLIKIVDSVYYLYEKLLLKNDDYKELNKINLNKIRVDDVFKNYVIDKEFNMYIQFYIRSFNMFSIYEGLQIENIFNQLEKIYFTRQARYRTKAIESVNEKLNIYTNKKENGKIKIKKCLNDLFGVRFVIINYNEIRNEFIDFLDEHMKEISSFNSKVKFTVKGYGEVNAPYIADHVYYSSKLYNNIFPMELQIWDNNNMELNEKSHKEYKRGYKNWSNQYNNIR